jgi:ATP-dependent DNA helicase RecG
MHPSLEHLQKILKNEISMGYENRSVIGGLPKMLGFWEPNARRSGLSSTLIDDLVTRVRAYPEAPADARPAAIEALLTLIQTASANEAPPAAATPARPAPAPVRPTPAPAPAPSAPRPPARRERPAPEPRPEPRRDTPRPAAAPEAPVARAPQTPAVPQPATPAPASAAPEAAPASAPAAPAPTAPAPSIPLAPEKPAVPRYTKRPPMTQEVTTARPNKSRRPPELQPLKAETPLNTGAGLDAPLTVLRGIGPERQAVFEKVGIATLRDLLLYYPRRYDNYSAMKPINRLDFGEECSVIGTVADAQSRRIRGGQTTLLKVILTDSTGALEISFFNQPWLADKLKPGKQIVVSGRVDQYLGRLTLVPAEWEDLDQELLNTGRIVPVYRLTEGLTQRALRKVTAQVTEYWARRQPDTLPAEIVRRAELLTYGEALAQIHFPENTDRLEAARHRLAFDELLLLQLGVLRQRRDWQTATAAALVAPPAWLPAFIGALPYALTGAQQRALADICTDLAQTRPMNRLLQGDVGSGKTVIAAAAMAMAVQAGTQAALMAPTSILAEQHYRTLLNLMQSAYPDLPAAAIRLLQGATPAAEKAEIYAGVRSGEIKMIVGTHALLEDPVEFARLGLAVVDEQHRFGVAQRAVLRAKGEAPDRGPHLLVMTATPIPRSLALTVYGDLDLSVLDELPPGRQPIKTHLLHAGERERGYAFIRAQVLLGRQAFLIFPLVEESEKSDAKAAVAEHQRLQAEVFREFKVGLLHGRLKPEEKEEVMARFRAGEYQILVSTSVVEVGVDVPNATVMMVEGANRFGLAQLHQFRGRVGRGPHPSFCLLASDITTTQPVTDERLLAMEQSQDGFYLAQKDLDLRGPGDFLGTRQAGFAGLFMAKLSDLRTIEKARREAQLLFERDPDLQLPEHQALAKNLAQFWTPGSGDVS